jgi:hypothetical protein
LLASTKRPIYQPFFAMGSAFRDPPLLVNEKRDCEKSGHCHSAGLRLFLFNLD